MALIPCPECGATISDQAPACIHCGFPLAQALKDALGEEEVTLTTSAAIMTCNYSKSYSLFKIYAQMESEDTYRTFFGGTAAPAVITLWGENAPLLTVPADAEISATRTILTAEFQLEKASAKALQQSVKRAVLTRTARRKDLSPTADATKVCCPRCGSTSVQLMREDFDLGGALVGGLLLGGAGFVVGAMSGEQLQRVCINCGHKF